MRHAKIRIIKVVSGAGGKFKPLDSVLNTLSRGLCILLFPYLNSL